MERLSTDYYYLLLTLLVNLISILTVSSPLFSQENSRIYRHYATQEVATRLLTMDSEMTQKQSEIEQAIADFEGISQLKEITIPVIFHNLYHTEEQKVSEAVIANQLATLNTAFQLKRNWTHPGHDLENWDDLIPATTGIQFCLANVNSLTEAINQINYLPTSIEEWNTDDAIKSSSSGILPYAPDRFLNIWIANLGDNKIGYAQMPWGAKETDGIVIDYRYFGTKNESFELNQQGKALVHLIGSYLGLYELWDDKEMCKDDKVADTPIHNGPNYGPQETYRHISLCSGYPVEQTANFMDATDDAYTYFFTTGQVARMQAVLQIATIRNGLTKATTDCVPLSIDVAEITQRSSRSSNEIKKLNPPNTITVFPNPANQSLNIVVKGDFEELNLLVSDVSGQLIQLIPIGKVHAITSLQLDCSLWSPGIYFIKSKDNQLHYKFIIAR